MPDVIDNTAHFQPLLDMVPLDRAGTYDRSNKHDLPKRTKHRDPELLSLSETLLHTARNCKFC
jgi:hypothetical protein